MNGESLARTLPLELAVAPSDRLASLCDVHHNRLYRLARRLAPTKDDALDLVQETFLKAARSLQSIPTGASQEEAWLVRVLINIQRDQWRKRSIREYQDKAVRPFSTSDPEAAFIAKEMVWQALNILSPRRRAIVVILTAENIIPAFRSGLHKRSESVQHDQPRLQFLDDRGKLFSTAP